MTGAVLSAGNAALILFGAFFTLMLLRVPVAFALGLACLPILVIEPRLDAQTLVQETFNAYNSFILLAVPFFLLAANLMNAGGITDRLVRFSRALVGHFPGGLAQVNVVLSIFFAGISGSSTADAASQSKIFIEAQTKEGYDLSFSVAITAVSAVLAVIIPPSILMIVWGGILTTSIGALFLAGIIPGLLIGFVQMGTVHAYAKLRGYPTYPRATFREFLSSAAVSIPALLMPLIIIGGKGWFTATESAGIAVIYAIILCAFFYRELSFKGFYESLLDTGRLAAVALFCVGTASAFGWLLAYYQIPKAILAGVSAWGLGFYGTGFFIAFVFLVVGCFLDAIPAIIIVGTILQPLAQAVHMHPVHFAMIGIVSLAFGLVTPPYGLCLMISCSVAGIRMIDALKDTIIMLLPMLGVLALVILWPDVVLFLPRIVSPEFLKVFVKLGFFTMPLHPVGKEWRRTLAEDREAILLADELGFEEAYIGEHVTDLAETITSCLIFIATLARATKRIKLGSATVNLANRHPAVTAAEIAMVDTMLEGRFILGVGPGGLPSDAEMMETMDADRNAIFLESIEHMIALWTQDPPYRLAGKRWRLSTERTWTPDLGMGGMLKPFQKPYPPIVVTAILPASNGIAAAAARGWTPISANFVQPWVVKTHWPKYVEGCKSAGREAKGADWRVAKSIFVAEDDATLRRMTRDPGNPFAYYFRNLQRKAQRIRGNALFKHAPDVPDEAVTDEYLVSQLLISGTVNEVVDKLQAFREQVGPFGRLLYCGHDWADAKAMRRSMELMAGKVLPRL